MTEAGTSGEAGNSTLKKKYSKEWGMDEFTMMSDLKSEFPLHYVVFRQVSSHMSHEGNVESVFALAKRLSHPCSKPRTVTLLTLMGANKRNCKPNWQKVWARYQAKYGKQQYDSNIEQVLMDEPDSDSDE